MSEPTSLAESPGGQTLKRSATMILQARSFAQTTASCLGQAPVWVYAAHAVGLLG
jgi:hypothetical protein